MCFWRFGRCSTLSLANQAEHLQYQTILSAAALSAAGAVLIALLLRLISGRRFPWRATLAAGGLAMAGSFSYHVVERAYLLLGLPKGTEPLAWIVAWVALLATAVSALQRAAVRRALAVAAIVVVAIPAAELTVDVLAESSTFRSSIQPKTITISRDDSTGLPNVYYFILDMYSRGDSLKQYYGYDNSAFLSFLKQRGFRIATKSHSNYRSTETSITTTLYMDYVIPALRDGKQIVREAGSAVPVVAKSADRTEMLIGGGETELSGWRPYGNNVLEETDRTLTITRIGGEDSDKGAYAYLSERGLLISNVIVGKQYRLIVKAKADSGNARVGLAGGDLNADTSLSSTSFDPRTFDFVATAADQHFIFFSGLNVNDTVSVADVELRPLSSMTRTLEDIKFPFVMDPNLFDAYLGSSQHLSPVLTTFRNLNFQVLFANLAGTTTDACAPYCITGEGHLTAQQLDLLRLTPLVDVVKVRWPHAWLNLVQVYQKNPMVVVRQIPTDAPKPFFLFAHILSPHPPFIYHSDCSIRDEFLLDLDPTTAQFLSDSEMHRQYVEQIPCVNTQMMEAVDAILKRDENALIVIQGDHGLGHLAAEMGTYDGKMRARYGILNAFRLPERCADLVYDSISSVNTFRLVFACLAGAQPNFVPDRTFDEMKRRAAPEIHFAD